MYAEYISILLRDEKSPQYPTFCQVVGLSEEQIILEDQHWFLSQACWVGRWQQLRMALVSGRLHSCVHIHLPPWPLRLLHSCVLHAHTGAADDEGQLTATGFFLLVLFCFLSSYLFPASSALMPSVGCYHVTQTPQFLCTACVYLQASSPAHLA